MKPFSTKLALIALSALLIISIGCSKEDKQPTAAELLSKSWIQIDLLATVNGISESVFADEYEPCDQDNAYNFKSDGTFTVTDNILKCNPTAADQVATGTWTILEGGKKITITRTNEEPQTLDIEELTATSMKVSVTDNSIGIPVKATLVFRAK
jgi:hypothetical protein